MRKLITTLALIALLFPYPASAAGKKGGGGGYAELRTYLQADLPTDARQGAQVLVIDGEDDADCGPTGTGAFQVVCFWNGAGWEASGDSGSGAGDDVTINSSGILDPDFDTSADILVSASGQDVTWTLRTDSVRADEVEADAIGTAELNDAADDAAAGETVHVTTTGGTATFEYLSTTLHRSQVGAAGTASNGYTGDQCSSATAGGACNNSGWKITDAGAGTFQSRVEADTFDTFSGGSSTMTYGDGDIAAHSFVTGEGTVTVDGMVSMLEQSDHATLIASSGAIWVKTGAPSTIWFTDDAAGDFQLGVAGTPTLDTIADPAGDTAWTFDAGEELAITAPTAADEVVFKITIDQVEDGDATDAAVAIAIHLGSESGDPDDTLNGLVITVDDGAANTIIDAGIVINNAEDTTSTLTNGVIVTSTTSGGVTTAFNASDLEIVTALAIGSNTITTSSFVIEAAELNKLNGLDAALVDLDDTPTWAGNHDFSAVMLEIPNGAGAPTSTDCDGTGEGGRIYADLTGAAGSVLWVCQDEIAWEKVSAASGGGSGFFTDADPSVMSTTTYDVHIGDAAGTLAGKLEIGGDADQPQLVIEGHSTQTDSIVVVQQDDDTEVFTISNTGAVEARSIGDIEVGDLWSVTTAGAATFASFATTASPTPTVAFNDDDTDDTVDAKIVANATDEAAAQEDVDITITTLVNAVLTDRVVIDADGNTKILASPLQVNDPIFILEQAEADTNVATYGQIWVNTAVPNELWFTDDADNDVQLGAGAINTTAVDATTWSDNANASNIWTFNVSGTDHTMTAGSAAMTFSHAVGIGTAGVLITPDGDGAITLLGAGDGSDEDLTLNFDDTANTIVVSSSTGVTTLATGAIAITSAIAVITTTDGTESPAMYGQMYFADHDTGTSDTTYTLPAVAAGMSACFYDFGGNTGKIILDPNTNDHITLNGTAAADNENIESPGSDGDFLCLFSNGTNWFSLGRSGTWVEASP